MRISGWLFAFLAVALFAAPASASITVDGVLDEWGVTPFVDWNPDSSSAYFTVEDNYNRPGSDPFREIYDLEAMYFDSDADNLYFAIVSSNHYTSGWASEDLAMDLDKDGFYEFGLDLAYAPLGQVSTKGVYSVDSWLTYRGLEYRINKGLKIGIFSVYNKYLGAIEGPGTHTYVLEGSIPRSVFSGYADITCGSPLKMHFIRITCVKDWITTEGNVSSTCSTPMIPEPTTLFLMGGGLLAAAGWKRFKK